MTTCRCENCHNTFEAQPGKIRNCPYCGKGLLVYKCGSCMKTSGLLMQRQSMVCPRCFTMVRPNERLLIARGPLLLAPPSSPTHAPRKRPFDVMMQPLPVLILQRPQPQLQLQLQLTVLQQMEQVRDKNCITLYRVCSKEEAQNTVGTFLAGGRVRQLVRFKASEQEAVNQVGNSEGIVSSKGVVDKRLLLLQEKGLKIATTPLPERTVVEYSPSVASQFSGEVVMIEVNIAFTVKGSNLSFENGVILQIGTPLKSAVIYKGSVMPMSFLTPTCKPGEGFLFKKKPPDDESGPKGGFGGMGSKGGNLRLQILKSNK